MLPAALQAAIDARMTGVSRNAMATACAAMTQSYRSGRDTQQALAGPLAINAYLLARLPATYAAVAATLVQVRASLPDFQPRRILDMGAGPGGASWAAVTLWPGIETITMVDAHAGFRQTALELAAAAEHPALQQATYRLENMVAAGNLPPADLILCSYTLGETAATAALATRWWESCQGVLLVVEPGTPRGYDTVIEARAALLAAGARLAAPCPHTAPCPIQPPDWCHFATRLNRTRDHMLLKGATVPFEDEKFSYVAASRLAPVAFAARAIAPPVTLPAGIACKLCVDPGLIETRLIPKRDKATFKRYKKLRWGEAIEETT